MKSNKLNFLNNPEKIELLKNANRILNITQSNLPKIIFVYSKPKVGSTSIVTSLRIFASHMFNIIHIHDEEMLKVLSNISGVTVNEIILYNHFVGKQVFVIDVYRSPIERKMSAFFEKIDCIHFNNHCSEINKYDINKLFNRFDKIFPYIGNGDQFIDTYEIVFPEKFDYENKYLNLVDDGVTYIKLRLKDSNIWGKILTKLLGTPINIIKDYETVKKPIKDAYLSFKENYKIPKNLLEDLNDCPYLDYYYSVEEKNEYLDQWKQKSKDSCASFTIDEYKIYEYISNENNHLDTIQIRHYLDEGCACQGCKIKRSTIQKKILNGEPNIDSIIHEDVKMEIAKQRIENFNVRQINNMVNVKRMPKVGYRINLFGGITK